MLSKKAKIAIAITIMLAAAVVSMYVILRSIRGYAHVASYNYGLNHGYLNRQHAIEFGLATYDVNVVPRKFPVGDDFIEITDAWIEVGNYRKQSMSTEPSGRKRDPNESLDWKAIHLCFSTNGTHPSIERCDLKLKGLPRSAEPREYVSRDSINWCFMSPPYMSEIHGYLTKVVGSDFVVHIPWEEVRKDWDIDSNVWYPGCNDPIQSKI